MKYRKHAWHRKVTIAIFGWHISICLIPFPKYVFGLWSIFWRQVTILYHAILVSYIIFLWIECVVALYYTITITYYVAILLYDETTTRTTCVCVCLAVIIKGLSFIFSEIEFTQYTKAQSTKLHSYWNCYKMKLLFRYFDIKRPMILNIYLFYLSGDTLYKSYSIKLYSIYSNGQQT